METPFGIHVHSVKDVPAQPLIEAFANHLKRTGKFRIPSWTDCVKTGIGRELGPYRGDWLLIRAAALLRHLYFHPDQGVGAMTTVHGKKKRRGSAPGHHTKGAGGIIRYCFQQFESIGLVKKSKTGGRRLTPKGQQELCAIAKQVGSVETAVAA